MENYLDMERPNEKTGETICDGCWYQSSDIRGWIYFGFKHLKSQNLCTKCIREFGEKFQKLQEHGL